MARNVPPLQDPKSLHKKFSNKGVTGKPIENPEIWKFWNQWKQRINHDGQNEDPLLNTLHHDPMPSTAPTWRPNDPLNGRRTGRSPQEIGREVAREHAAKTQYFQELIAMLSYNGRNANPLENTIRPQYGKPTTSREPLPAPRRTYEHPLATIKEEGRVQTQNALGVTDKIFLSEIHQHNPNAKPQKSILKKSKFDKVREMVNEGRESLGNRSINPQTQEKIERALTRQAEQKIKEQEAAELLARQKAEEAIRQEQLRQIIAEQKERERTIAEQKKKQAEERKIAANPLAFVVHKNFVPLTRLNQHAATQTSARQNSKADQLNYAFTRLNEITHKVQQGLKLKSLTNENRRKLQGLLENLLKEKEKLEAQQARLTNYAFNSTEEFEFLEKKIEADEKRKSNQKYTEKTGSWGGKPFTSLNQREIFPGPCMHNQPSQLQGFTQPQVFKNSVFERLAQPLKRQEKMFEQNRHIVQQRKANNRRSTHSTAHYCNNTNKHVERSPWS